MSSERQENNTDNPWWGEHIHRYKMALDYMRKPAEILDIACGSGFGSYLMAQNEFKVTGGDISEEAITICNQSYQHKNLKFIKTDGASLPFADKCFDAIISFETIEHTTHYLKLLQEFKRTLKSDGIIFLSTPNIIINSPDGVVRNPFHTQEWTYEELKEILNGVYPEVTILGQQYTRYKNRKGLGAKIAKLTESFFYLRGIRKLPLSFKNSIMQMLVNVPMYPTDQDYELVSNIEEIMKCKTFVALCKIR